jgi:hypothetical protein
VLAVLLAALGVAIAAPPFGYRLTTRGHHH